MLERRAPRGARRREIVPGLHVLLVECPAGQGRLDRARQGFDRPIATANALGLFVEEYDAAAGRMLGNFPHALTHLAHIEAAPALDGAAGRVT